MRGLRRVLSVALGRRWGTWRWWGIMAGLRSLLRWTIAARPRLWLILRMIVCWTRRICWCILHALSRGEWCVSGVLPNVIFLLVYEVPALHEMDAQVCCLRMSGVSLASQGCHEVKDARGGSQEDVPLSCSIETRTIPSPQQ